MATILPSPDFGSVPAAAIPPVSSIAPPQFSTPPLPSTSSPPVPSTLGNQLDATPPDSSTLSPPSPPPNAPPPTTSETPVVSSPVDSSPPPTTSAPPLPSQPASPPPTPISTQPPPSDPSPPPSPDVSPPPPVASPPPITVPPPNPPTSSPPPLPPPVATPPPTSSPPPVSSPTPPSLNPPANPPPSPPSPSSSSESPALSPPPPSSEPPVNSPPSPPTAPPKKSPSAPHSSPSTPAVETPTTSPPSTTNPPPSEPGPLTPPTPSSVSHDSPPSSVGPPIRGPETAVQSSPTLPAQDSGSRSEKGSNTNGGIGSGGVAAIGVVAGVLMIGLIGFIAVWIIKRKKRNNGANDAYIIPASLGSSPGSDMKLVVKTGFPSPPFGGSSNSNSGTPSGHGGFGHSKPWFTYQELSEATGGFSDHNILGEGGFGYVYKGILVDGRVVAVKQLKTGGGQGEREFQAEVEIISRIHHRHLVSLVGYCISESKRLLVYDYVPNNTLYFHLHGEGRPAMDWATRLKIATGSARGLAYLHEDCHPRVIHRDIKSSNILIDNNFEAQVADFGLARLAMDADTHVSTRVMGTFGYLAPEYATSGKLTEKSDVYSFGVVLLELITGRKPVDESQPLGDESLVEWARPLLNNVLETGEFEGLVDPRLEKNYIESEMYRMIEAAAACVRHSSTKRPRMGQVVRALEGISDSGDLSNGLRVGESRMYDPAQQSAEIRWFKRVAFGSQGISSDFFNHDLSNSFQSDISRQHNQTSPSIDFSRQSRQNANLSAAGGGISRSKHSNLDFFRQGQ